MSLNHRLSMHIVRCLGSALVVGAALCAHAASAANANSLEKPPDASAVIVTTAPPTRTRAIRPQIAHVGTPVANHYVKADSVGLAVAAVPDPLVPRYGRLFDIHVQALELGMLKDGYVLDRFSFPWSEELRHESEEASHKTSPPESNTSAGSYGLMIFRCDEWRGDTCAYPHAESPEPPRAVVPRTRIRALYLVTETATSGIARFAFECAIRRIEVDTGIKSANWGSGAGGRPCPESIAAAPGAVTATLLRHSLCPAAPDDHSIVVLGPSFSGSMNSIGETVEGRIPDAHRRVCLVSSSATDRTNERATEKFPTLHYSTVALDNESKLQHLDDLTKKLGADDDGKVAILAEASTFGYGVCHGIGKDPGHRTKTLCDRSAKVFFPPGIADIAYGLQKQQAQEAGDLVNATRQVQNDRHVSLEGGAENGSEFPANQSPEVTTASNQLQLDQVMDTLARIVPTIVIVVATDVRDRLFLFDQLREKLPRAMLVDLEADNLLAHPEFLHASRGAIAMASVNLTSMGSVFARCSGREGDFTHESWSIDVQGMLADNTAHLYETSLDEPAARLSCGFGVSGRSTRQAALHIVTFQGLKPVSRAFLYEPTGVVEAVHPRYNYLIVTESLAALFVAALTALWLWPWSLRRVRRRHAGDQAFLNRLEAYFIGGPLLFGTPFLLMALVVAYGSTDRGGHPFMYFLLAMEVVGVIAAWRCYGHIRTTLWAARYPTYSALWLSIVLALFSIGFAGAAAWVTHDLEGSEHLINSRLLDSLGFDPGSGVAFYLVATVAGITTLYSAVIIATRTWVVRRNFRLLFLAHLAAMRSQSSSNRPTSFFSLYPKNGTTVHDPHGYKPLSMWVTVLIGVFIFFTAGAPGLLDYLGGPRLTVFGPVAARVAVLALAATTLCAAILLIAAYGAGRRIIALCGYARGRILDSMRSRDGMDSAPVAAEIPGLWDGGREMPNAFAATPVLAIDCGAGRLSRGFWTNDEDNADTSAEKAGRAWAAALSQIMYQGKINGRTRFALFALLVSELSLFRWIAVGAVLSAFASVGIVFLYPIEADTLLILNLLILALAGLLCAYLAVVFERDGVLSNVVCNRPQRAEISIGLFSFIASPFVALAAAIALVEIPGVVDWAGGLFVMVRTLGIHP